MVRSRRRSVARLFGWGAALVLYAAGLLYSVELISAGTAQPAAIEPASAVTIAAAQDAESPIVTITLAATVLVVAATVRAARSARQRHVPQPQQRRLGARVSSPTA